MSNLIKISIVSIILTKTTILIKYLQRKKTFLRIKQDDWTKWTDEASGAYIWYVSIAEEGTSSRACLNAKEKSLSK